MAGQHFFLQAAGGNTAAGPSARWRQAFAQGLAAPWAELSRRAGTGDCVWVSVGSADWPDQVRALARGASAPAVVVVSAVPYGAEGLRAIDAGAKGYCNEQALPELLQEVARVVAMGGLWVGPELVERLVAATRSVLDRVNLPSTQPPLDLSALSPREMAVVREVVAGAANKVVAKRLDISERTVKAHLGSVFEKLGLSDRMQLVVRLSGQDLGPTQVKP